MPAFAGMTPKGARRRDTDERHGRNVAAQAGAGGQPDRHGGRILRLLHLCHRRQPDLPLALLPGLLALGAVDGFLWQPRPRLPRPSPGRRRLRPLWRPHRAQGDARHLADADGRLHIADRLPADLSHDRLLGAADPVRAAFRPGLWPGRRMGRRGAAGGRECSRRLARPLRHVPATGRPGRLHRRQWPVPAACRSWAVRSS
jgi:hypothetical protein